MISIVVGSMTEITEKQIAHLHKTLQNDGKASSNNVALYYLRDEHFSRIRDKEFLRELSISNTLIMSGGETAYSLLDASGFDYLISGGQIMPLISTGKVSGGLFNGLHYIIKGGSIGEINIYEKMIEFAMENFGTG
ncbi:MAG: nucleotide-binding domain containing protein [Ferroplasma sp.]|jgi:uncharacterized protein YgbK (DUF1537 family)|uniref:nucleotide-binding domain containing protein n=1 Tax=Ferroplasma sp. TaxID=2591003 RepID=UPI002814F0F9|nr:nucleotide-binding domain containing protein [Ferroplasma sp.]WMT50741.1 MAG: nucleotide-binding domain containing protein [Ferroplasma sp.]